MYASFSSPAHACACSCFSLVREGLESGLLFGFDLSLNVVTILLPATEAITAKISPARALPTQPFHSRVPTDRVPHVLASGSSSLALPPMESCVSTSVGAPTYHRAPAAARCPSPPLSWSPRSYIAHPRHRPGHRCTRRRASSPARAAACEAHVPSPDGRGEGTV